MKLEKWDKKAVIRYMQQSKRGYAGDVLSSEIVRLSRKYIGSEVLEHLDDKILDKALSEIHRVLKKQGFLIITVPHEEDFKQSITICPKCGAKFHRVGHMQVFNKKRMREILEKKGFVIVTSKVLPLGFIATHKFLKHFRYFLAKFRLLSLSNLFVVVVKTGVNAEKFR